MASYRVLQRSFLNDRTYEEGETVEYNGIPADNLHPICKDAKAATDAARKAGINTSIETDWAPMLSISDAAKALAGTTAAQSAEAVAAVEKIMSGASSPSGSAVAAFK